MIYCSQISEIKEATHIHDLCLLRELNLQRNLVQVAALHLHPEHITKQVSSLMLSASSVLTIDMSMLLLSLLFQPQEQLDYRLAVIFLLQHLTGLDQEKVTVEEKAGWMYEMVISDGT